MESGRFIFPVAQVSIHYPIESIGRLYIFHGNQWVFISLVMAQLFCFLSRPRSYYIAFTGFASMPGVWGSFLKGPFSMLNDEQMSSSNWRIWIELLAAWMELKFLEESFERGSPPKGLHIDSGG